MNGGEAYCELGSPILLDKSGVNLDGLLPVEDGVFQFAQVGESEAAVVEAPGEVYCELGCPFQVCPSRFILEI